MNILFSVDFRTRFGQNLFVTGSLPELGGGDLSRALPMTYCGERWQAKIKINTYKDKTFNYRYFVREEDGLVFQEVGQGRTINLHSTANLTLMDAWQGNDDNAPFLHSPFANIFLAHRSDNITHTHKYSRELIIRVTAPIVESDAEVFLSGSCRELGAWDPSKALHLKSIRDFKWEIHLDMERLTSEFKYKFIKRYRDGSVVWEEGEDHYLSLPQAGEGDTLSVEHSADRFHGAKPRYAGMAVPVFSLRSREDCGIGEFSAIKLMADWASATGQRIIQLLPINDTTSDGSWRDSYPYNCISVMALHPMYINIQALGELPTVELKREFDQERRVLNALPMLDYERVFAFKMKYLKILFETYWAETAQREDFKEFVAQNRDWLAPYGKYCAKRDKAGNRYFYQYVQYHLSKQLTDAVEYAHSKGVALKGDIPIGVSPLGVEAATEPHLFHLDSQAGAPPDDFAEDGQNWGFPTYNWEAIGAENYRWWKRRLTNMERYFDAYRIDHILGFFRIWEIPSGYRSGIMGHFNPALPLSKSEIEAAGLKFRRGFKETIFFEDPVKKGLYHPGISAHKHEIYQSLTEGEKLAFNRLYEDFFYVRHNKFWERIGYQKLPEIVSASNMLPCAEDLGMIPDCVPGVLRDLKILTLEVQRMPKEYGCSIGNPARYPYLSVCTTGTHDMETLRGWKGECPVDQVREIIREHLESPAMLTILPLQDWLALTDHLRVDNPADERINTPADPNNRWRYRMNIYIEDLMKESHLNGEILQMIKASRG